MEVTTETFLQAILPNRGWYYAGEPITRQDGRSGFRNVAHADIPSLAQHLIEISNNGRDAYMGLAEYKEKLYTDHKNRTRTRTAENATRCRSFWVDIDCGDDKAYATHQDGLKALKQFLKDTALPAPTHVVDSGGGLHVYWSLDHDLPKQKWQHMAEMFKRLAVATEFKVDYKCTADIARVLRPVGTINTKYGESGKTVTLLMTPKPSLGTMVFARALATACQRFEVKAPSDKSDTKLERPDWMRDGDYSSDLPTNAFSEGVGYTPPDANRMAEGCQMLRRMREHKGANQSYLEWFYSLTLLQKSAQGEEICHEWSSGYADYSAEDTDAKLEEVRDGKPVLCDTVRHDLPDVCAGCPQTCNSAVSLGFPKITTPEQVIDEDTGQVEPIDMAQVHEDEFRWTEKRGLERYVVSENDDGEKVGNWKSVCKLLPLPRFLWADDNNDKWVRMAVRKRIHDYEVADIPLASIGQGGSALTKDLAGKGGLLVEPAGRKHMEHYMKTWIDHSMETTDFGSLSRYMGWQPDGSFLHGNTLYHRDGSKTTAAVSNALVKSVTDTEPRGSLEAYTKAIDELYNHPNAVHFQIAWMASLASPLLYLDAESPIGQVLGLSSPISGVGKTSVALLGMAAWGDPTEGEGTLGARQTTEHAMYVTAGQRRNLPVLIDETTDWTTETLAKFLYSYSIGQPKAQGAADGGLRNNSHLRWYNVCYLTTNKNGTEDLIASGGNAEPKIARMFEISFPQIHDNADTNASRNASLIKAASKKHTGQAGAKFIETLMPMADHIPEALQKQADWLREQTEVGTVGRYWLQMGASLLVAFAVAKKAGLHDFDGKAFKREIVRTIRAMSRRAAKAVPAAEDVVGQYLTSIHSGLIVTREMGGRGKTATFLHGYGPPKGEIKGRVVADGAESGVYIPVGDFKNWCSEHAMPYQNIRQELTDLGILKDSGKRMFMGKGTNIPSGQSRCWHLTYRVVDGSLSSVSSNSPQDDEAVEQ